MKAFMNKSRIIAATIIIMLLAAVFLAGAHRGYKLGYTDGGNTANGWWIDKKSRYYESAEVRKKHFSRKHNQI